MCVLFIDNFSTDRDIKQIAESSFDFISISFWMNENDEFIISSLRQRVIKNEVIYTFFECDEINGEITRE